jgi:hypothetical protein
LRNKNAAIIENTIYNIPISTAWTIQSFCIKKRLTIHTISRSIFSIANKLVIFGESFLILDISLVNILVISKIIKTIKVLYKKALYAVNSNNIYQNINTFIDPSNAANIRAQQYLLNDNFLKSILHIIKIAPAAKVNKNEFRLLPENNKNPNTTVNTVSNSQ